MQRKLVKHGESTLMVSIPSKWIKKNNLEKGDSISIQEIDSQLILQSKSTKKIQKTIRFTLPENPTKRWIRAFISHNYRRGANVIVISNCSKENIDFIINLTTKHLIGFEANQIDKTTIQLEQILNDNLEHFENFYNKILFLINNNFEELQTYIKNLDEETFSIIARNNEQCDRYINYCKRWIQISHLEKDKNFLWDCLSNQTQIMHSITYTAKYLKEKNAIIKNKNIIEFLKKINLYYSKIKKSILKGEINFDFEDEYSKLKKEFFEIIEITKKEESAVMWYLGEQLRNSMLFIYRTVTDKMLNPL